MLSFCGDYRVVESILFSCVSRTEMRPGKEIASSNLADCILFASLRGRGHISGASAADLSTSPESHSVAKGDISYPDDRFCTPSPNHTLSSNQLKMKHCISALPNPPAPKKPKFNMSNFGAFQRTFPLEHSVP